MSGILTLPRLGETMEEGRITAWLVAPGQQYRRGDPLLEVETDKTVVEVPALEDGEVAVILAPEGAQVRVGDPVARLAAGERETSDRIAIPSAPPEPLPAPPPGTEAVARPDGDPYNVRATPVARKLARQAGVLIGDVPGTGRRNRVERDDVVRHLENPASGSAGHGPVGLAHDLSGPETGPPVVLLHGFAGDRTLWAGVRSGLTRAGARLLVPDLPGHGETQAEALSPAELSNGLSDLVAQTLDGPAHVVAHSLGAIPAVALAEAGAARSLTLIAPVGLGLGLDRSFLNGLAMARSAGEVAHLLQRMSETPLQLSPDALERIAGTLGRGRLIRLAKTLVGAAGQTVSLRARLARIAEDRPVRIIAPHRDRIVDWSDMITVSPRIAVHHLPGAGHMAPWDAPGDVTDILRTALDGDDRSRKG